MLPRGSECPTEPERCKYREPGYFHVHHRPERYGAVRCMELEADGRAEIAGEIGREIGFRPWLRRGDAQRLTRFPRGLLAQHEDLAPRRSPECHPPART
jgi:hypothetical protein